MKLPEPLSKITDLLRGKPEVEAAAPALVTVANVPLLEAGVEYLLSTGPTTFTPEDLRDVVTAANEDHSIPSPRLKIGHVDPRYNSNSPYDGTPAFGKAMNLRLSENGMCVLADYVGVPKWLADVMPVAYPNRSIEGFWNVEAQSGKKWRFVLSAVALLGVVWPGVTVLEDLPLYYGAEMPDGVELVGATAATGGDPMKTEAAANLDDIRRAFYNEYVASNPEAQLDWWWIRAVLTDPNQLVVEDETDGQLYLLDFTSDKDGNVSFGEPNPVRIDYIPDSRESKSAAAMGFVAAAATMGHSILVSYATRAESRPETQGGGMDGKALRQHLDLPEDASDEQVEAKLGELKAGVAASGEGPTVTPPEPVAPAAAATTEEKPEPVAAATRLNLPEGVVVVEASMLEELREGHKATQKILEDNAEAERERLVAAALQDGRIHPSRKDAWIESLKADPGAKDVLASLTPGLVPVDQRSIGGSLPESAAAVEGETVLGWSSALFPEVAATRELEAKVRNEGRRAYPLIMRDEAVA